jgi:hypothetical protein
MSLVHGWRDLVFKLNIMVVALQFLRVALKEMVKEKYSQ